MISFIRQQGSIMKKKILFVSNNGQGFYNFKKELIEKLISMNYEVHFAVPEYIKLKELETKGAYYEAISVDRRGMNPIKDIKLIWQLRKLFKMVKPDIVLLHTIKPNIYGSCIAKYMKLPYINNITGLGSALQIESNLSKLIRTMYKFSFRKTRAVFFENTGNLNYFIKHGLVCEGKCILVKGAGVNTEYYKYSINNKMCIEDKDVRFLFIGRIMRDKGIAEYLEAAKYIKGKYGNVTFQVLGYFDDDLYKIQLEELVSKGVVEYLGVSDDTRVEMEQADCIVLPSYHEGMSNVLLEGAAFGLPIITTDIDGCREAVDDERTGFLCERQNAASLIEAIEKIYKLSDQQRYEMGQRGREKMIHEFDRNHVIDAYVEQITAYI